MQKCGIWKDNYTKRTKQLGSIITVKRAEKYTINKKIKDVATI